MSSTGTVKFNLRQKPNSRERIIFFLALFAFIFGFYKACVVESSKAAAAIQADVDKAKAEREQLSKRTPLSLAAIDAKVTGARDTASKINWIGKRPNIELSSDALLEGAQDNGIFLIRYGLSSYVDKQSYIMKPLSLTIAGPLRDIGRYLESSEHLAVPFVIERFMLNPNGEFSGILTLRIDGGFYATK